MPTVDFLIGETRMVQMLTRKDAAKLLTVSESTMRRWASQGFGPKPVKLTSNTVVYRPEDLAQFVDEAASPKAPAA